MQHLLSLTLTHDQDVVTARQRAAQVAGLLGFDNSEQTRIATAVSEIVRNAFRYAGGGAVDFDADEMSRPQRLVIRVADEGGGIPRLAEVLDGRYRSATGMGMGIVGARRLMDRFDINSSPRGTTVVLEKFLPHRAPLLSRERADHIAETMRLRRPQGLVEEIQHQNQELLRTLDEVQRKQQELAQLNRELEDTNRGVVALYAELEEKADHLRRADDLKSRFLSNMTHEFRTPVNSIIGLCNLLMDDRHRASLDPEPEVMYIRKAADQLSELVNDLLDLAKVEAGKIEMRVGEFEVDKLFGALRGMLRPLLLNQSVALVFEDAAGLPRLRSDEGKIAQILRNLISNALKFTERGEVRVGARVEDQDGNIAFSVQDTGIGIALEDQARIFDEFTQLEHRLQRGVHGTGLGLSLSRRLAELLGGSISVESTPGVGSTFRLLMPIEYRERLEPELPFDWVAESGKLPLLVVDDASDAQFFYQKILRDSAFQIYPARTVAEAERALHTMRPAAILLDIVLRNEESWELLLRLKQRERTRPIPVIVVSVLHEDKQAMALGADAYLTKPIERRALLDTLTGLLASSRPPVRVLSIDDEEVARFLIRQCLPVPAFEVIEATGGAAGLERAREDRPDVIVMDLIMPGMSGRELLGALKADPATAGIPVIIATAAVVEPRDRRMLLEHAAGLVSKADLSRDTLPEMVRGVLGAETTRAAAIDDGRSPA